MNFEGIIIGIGVFLIIGILHPVLSKPNIILEREFGLYSLLGGFFHSAVFIHRKCNNCSVNWCFGFFTVVGYT